MEFLIPSQFNENPEIAPLWILRTNLDVAAVALQATNPDSREHSYSERSRTEQEAYALAILWYIDALNAMLSEYLESIQRRQQRRNRELYEQDTPF